MGGPRDSMLTAQDALNRLREGNARFASGVPTMHTGVRVRRSELVSGQEPFAIVLGCSDSRVPAELVFDQGLGDLFVIRVAGNVVAPSQIGSVEFAVEQFGTPLVVVLGHTGCGAVDATIRELLQPTELQSLNLRSIVDRIRPVVEPLLAAWGGGSREELARRAVVANIHASVEQVRAGSEAIEGLVEMSELLVVGALYDLQTGGVEFLDDGQQ